jgi:hypothetical protein
MGVYRPVIIFWHGELRDAPYVLTETNNSARVLARL